MSSAKAPKPGVYPPAVIFFEEGTEALDLKSIEKHVLMLANGRVNGIVVQGSNGEAPHLTHEERSLVIKTTRNALNANGFEHLPLIVGCGVASLRETTQLCKEAKQAGGDFALVLPPSYWPGSMTKPVLRQFFTDVADASPIPILVYNFPAVVAGIDIDSDMLIELGAHPNIVGTKISCGNVGKLQRVASSLPQDEFATFGGKSDFFLYGLLAGSPGVIAALVNLCPKAHVALYRAFTNGDMNEAKRLQALLSHADWQVQKTGVAGLKTLVAHYYDYGGGISRRPLQSPDVVSFVAPQKVEELMQLEKSL